MSQFVPFGTLFRYLAFRFTGWIFLCLFGLASIISLIQTVELARRISTHSETNESISYLSMAILNFPSVIEMTLPFSMLSGAILCYAAWNNSNEFVAVRGFGQTIWTSLGPALFSSFLIGMLYVTVVNPIGAVTSKRYKAQLAEVFGDTETNFSISSSGIWLHDTLKQGKLIIHGEALDPDAASIINPVIYFYAEDIHVTAIYQAKLIQLTDKGWILDDALRWQNDGQEEEIGSIMLPTGLGTLDLSQSGLAPQSISVYLLPRFISALERAGVSSVEYRFYLYKILSLPLMMVGIAMLAARITLNNVSQRRRMRLFIRGMFLAILIFFFTYFMQIMGISLRVPPEFAALTPAVTVVLIGAIVLARTDET